MKRRQASFSRSRSHSRSRFPSHSRSRSRSHSRSRSPSESIRSHDYHSNSRTALKRLKRYDSPSPNGLKGSRSHSGSRSRIPTISSTKTHKGRGDRSPFSLSSHVSEERDKRYEHRDGSQSSWSSRSRSPSRSPSPGLTLQRRSIHRLPVSHDISRPSRSRTSGKRLVHLENDRHYVDDKQVWFTCLSVFVSTGPFTRLTKRRNMIFRSLGT